MLKYTKFLFVFSTITLASVFNSLDVYAQEYGLQFKGQDYLLDERTGLDLTPNNFFEIEEDLTLSFDLKAAFLKEQSTFGYIFRMISEENQNIDLLLSTSKTNKLVVVVGDRQTVLPLDDSKLLKNQWVTIKLNFQLNKNQFSLSVEDSKVIINTDSFSKQKFFKLFFGANKYKNFVSSDVPEMSIKDIKLFNKGSLISHFPLNQCGGDTTKDIVRNKEAIINNSSWLLCGHKNWKLDFKSEMGGIQLVAADEDKGIIFILSNSSLLKYHLEDKSIEKVPYKNKIALTLDHKVIYNKNDNKIYCYLKDKQLVASLHIENGVWSNLETFSTKRHQQVFQKHNTIFNAKENAIYTFGGYGQYKYNNSVGKLNLKDSTWVTLSENDSIFKPRYLAGGDILNDSIYILGGYGSDSGSQLINPKSYFNLMAYSIKTNKFKEKFKVYPHLSDMIVANKMWINPKNRNYYALISDKIKFNGYSKLLKGSLDNSKTSILGDSIPFKFLDIKSISKLFYIPTQQKLVAYNSYLNKENITGFSINSIAFPVLENKKIIPKNHFSKFYYYYLIGSIFMMIVLFFYIKNQKNSTKVIAEEKETVSDEEEIIEKKKQKNLNLKSLENESDYQIVFFGGFQVINNKQEDITSKFSPLLKELFLLIWMHTFKNNKGISSAKLIEILWYDKPPRKAQNNRSVNIAKLRGFLRELGSCVINKETGYWKITHDYNELKTDYFQLLQVIDDKDNISKDRIDRLMKITEKGPFLFNLNYEWLESFKQDTSDKIIDTLITFADNFDITSDPDFILHLCDCVFNFDSISEEAVIYKCKAYNYKGNHSLAESTFMKFQKEYKLLYAQDFKYSFQEILENKN